LTKLVCASPSVPAYALITAGVQCSNCARVAGLSETRIIFPSETSRSSVPLLAPFGQLPEAPGKNWTSSVKAAFPACTCVWA
jgi:hypothetical protein